MWYLVGSYPNWISGGKQGKGGECGLTVRGTLMNADTSVKCRAKCAQLSGTLVYHVETWV